MMKRVSFSLAETYEADVIKKYQHLKKCSFSAAIKECLKLGAPVLNRINENIAAITDIEDKLRQFFNEEPFVQRTKPEIERYFLMKAPEMLWELQRKRELKRMRP